MTHQSASLEVGVGAAADDLAASVQIEEYEAPTTVDFIAQVGPARGAWFNDPAGNLLGLPEGPVPAGG